MRSGHLRLPRAGPRRRPVCAATCELGTIGVGRAKTVRVRRAVGYGRPRSSSGSRGCHALMCAHQDLPTGRRREQRTVARSYRSGGRRGRRRDAALRYISEVHFSGSQGRLRAPPESGGLRLARFAASFFHFIVSARWRRRRRRRPCDASSVGVAPGRRPSPARASACRTRALHTHTQIRHRRVTRHQNTQARRRGRRRASSRRAPTPEMCEPSPWASPPRR